VKNKETNSNTPERIRMTTETLITNSQNQKNNSNPLLPLESSYDAVPQHCQFPFHDNHNHILLATIAELFSNKNKVDSIQILLSDAS
jgi:hypothetical protein